MTKIHFVNLILLQSNFKIPSNINFLHLWIIMIEQDKILLKIKHSIEKEDSTAEIILFGSRARGDNTPVSDWDILVLIDNNKTIEAEDRFRNNLYDLELETGQIISPIVYSKEYWLNKLKYSPLFSSVTREGIRL